MTPDTDRKLANRRAIEALRNGVPNSDAVRILGCNQPAAEQRFKELLAGELSTQGSQQELNGILVSGGFGEGKSHLLTHFQGLALDQAMCAARSPSARRLPSSTPTRSSRAAVGSALVPGRSGRLVESLDLQAKTTSGPYGEFYGWVPTK